ncbi:unnamed protein product, partial [Prorocentrum cordatum]
TSPAGPALGAAPREARGGRRGGAHDSCCVQLVSAPHLRHAQIPDDVSSHSARFPPFFGPRKRIAGAELTLQEEPRVPGPRLERRTSWRTSAHARGAAEGASPSALRLALGAEAGGSSDGGGASAGGRPKEQPAFRPRGALAGAMSGAARDVEAEAAAGAEDIGAEAEIRNAGNKMTGIGVCMVMTTVALGFVYLSFCIDLKGCQVSFGVDLHDDYLYLALAHLALGVVVAVGVLSMRLTFNALGSGIGSLEQSTALNATNGDDNSSPETKRMTTQATIIRWTLLIQAIIKIVIFALLVDGAWLVYDASHTPEECNAAALAAFFPLAILTFILSFANTFAYTCASTSS